MSYTVIGSLRSPFVRMIRMYMLQNQLSHQFHIINFLEDQKDAHYLETVNPLNKVPVLIDGDTKIFDSRVIFNYLNQKHQLMPMLIEQENILTAIQGCMDVSVNLFLMERGGMKEMDAHPYIQRQKKRLQASLEFIHPWISMLNKENPTDWNYVSMALFSYLDWAHFRQLLNLSEYPELETFLNKFKQAPGIQETDFR